MMTAQRLVTQFGSLYRIAQASLEELSKVRGVGRAKAAQIKAACEISRRAEIPPSSDGHPIETVDTAVEVARRRLAGKKQEHFVALLLDTRHRILKVSRISVGTLDMSIVHPRETFREAIALGAAALIVAHNHPSGDPTPSREDLDLTDRLMKAGQLLGIPLLDHIIIGRDDQVSLQAQGWFPHA
jgi:DNA repair protein RadC